MVIEIWSDIVCPFCYIGKRRLEAALQQSDKKETVEIVWRSFQLDPSLETAPDKSVSQSLMEKKGWTKTQTDQVMNQVVTMAKTVDLHYDFDKAIVANSFDAHRFIHFAHTQGKQDDAKESLLKAYFVEGKNIADPTVLSQIAESIGLDAMATNKILKSDDYATEVQMDINTATQLGISGVPFFVFNKKYAVSGAQSIEVFLEALQRVD